MRAFLSLFSLTFLSVFANAQWQSIGYFDLGATSFYEDTTTDEFIVSGNFHFYNSDTVVGIGMWDGQNFTPMGCGLGWNCIDFYSNLLILPAAEIIKYQNQIFAVGGFSYADGNVVNGITIWNDTEWISVGKGLQLHDGSNGIGFGATIINDELYVYGVFDSIAGIEAHGLAKFDGNQWSNIYNLPVFESSSNPNFIYGVAIYKDEIYVAGNFNNPPTYTINDLAKWNGSEWVGVGNLVENSAIYNMLIYKNELYVSGDFNLLGNPVIETHSIARYDGSNWKTVGAGTDYQINDMRVFGDYLYIAGAFDHVDDLPIDDIARWDGSKWCGYNSNFDNVLTAVGMFRDSLYIGGGFWTINGDSSLRKIVRWAGGDSLMQCGSPVGIDAVTQNDFYFLIYPNPAVNQLNLNVLLPKPMVGNIEVMNLLGEELFSEPILTSEFTIDISSFPCGIYFVVLKSEGKVTVKKFIKMSP